MPTEVFLIGAALAVAVLLGRLLAGRIGVPDAAAYVLIGVAAGLVPGLPRVQVSPDVVLLAFLPPLVYYAAFFSDPRETMEHIGAVVGQSVGLVLATAFAVAWTLLLIFPDIGWAAALAFAAAIAPPDPVAATTVLQRLGVPGRLVTVLEGEGLINDAVALTLFAVAVANLGASPSVPEVLVRIVVQVAGGILFGLIVGIAVARLRERTRDPLSQAVWSLVTPFLAFVPAHLMHASGVLATVTAAVWLGTHGRGLVAPSARLQTETFWRVLNLLLVAFLFVLLGFQIPGIVAVVADYPVGTLLLASASLVAVVVVVRMAWALLVPPLVRRLRVGDDEISALSRKERLVLGWCGPRGAVSLAVALSLPLTMPDGAPFVRRDLLLFLTVVVVLATLVGQVLPLPALLRRLRLSPSEQERTEGLRAHRAMVDAALREVEDLAAQEEQETEGLEAMRQVLELRRDRLHRQLESEAPDGDAGPDERDLQLRMLAAERKALRDLARRGDIGRRTQIAISQELDLDETRLRRAR
ncbi:MAG TPA: Na+/H+ antiporter [Pseudonocardia sp.]|uniref:Na+/H+ antiporter n=1 Tax=Pseudonocardia sp. TaxID=60912 RepID=UPI002ED7F541